MIELASFAEHRVALAFSDYLSGIGITNHVEVETDRFAVFIRREQDLDRARLELDEFMDNPEDNKYWQASWQTGKVIEQPIDRRQIGAAGVLQGLWARGGLLTLLVTILCLITWFGLLANPEPVYQALNFPADPRHAQGEWWRFLTPVFLHFGLVHLLFNLLWWWDLGGLIERTQSRLQLLGVFLVTALLSNFWQFLEAGNGFGGLSGVVYGLLGYVWIYPLANPRVGFRVRREIVIFMVGWLLLGYSGILDNVLGKIANAAHTAGLVSGIGLGAVFGLLHRTMARPD
ncbi:MAG TPA: rhomboid family intramembrane serine protease GlpG [Fluviicoccus sp.]|nr:rhomboid family intramembrane serine protease GlpG [Fluviicoccus sp.]